MNTQYPNPNNNYDDDKPEIGGGSSLVASPPARNLLLLLLMLVVCGGAIYYIFAGSEPPKDPKAPKKEASKEEAGTLAPNVKPTPVPSDSGTVIALPPQLPEPPPLVIPTPPPPPAIPSLPEQPALNVPLPPPPPPGGATGISAVPGTAGTPIPAGASNVPPGLTKEQLQQRNRSGMIVLNGGAGPLSSLTDGTFMTGQDQALAKTSFDQATATIIGDTSKMIAQGKVLDAVLETAINTDLPGVLRAVVSRDIYAEVGNTVLIPHGSRLIGNYQTDVQRGQSRVSIIWTRLIRPDGVDIALDSPGTDELGRAGVRGIVNNRYFEIFRNSVLLSSLTVGTALAAETFTDSKGITNTDRADGSSTQSGTTTDFAVVEAINDLGDIAKNVVNDLIDVRPTITVDQGTPIKVFVNRDLIFPDAAISNVKVLQ